MSQDVNLTPEQIIVSYAKGVGVEVPDQYSTEFGWSLITQVQEQLSEKLELAQDAAVQQQYGSDNPDWIAIQMVIDDMVENIGLPDTEQSRDTVMQIYNEYDDARLEFDRRVASQGGANPESLSLDIDGSGTTTETLGIARSVDGVSSGGLL